MQVFPWLKISSIAAAGAKDFELSSQEGRIDSEEFAP
jgi:hypothetical protein